MFAQPQVNFGNGHVTMAKHGNDDGLYVEFRIEKVLQSHETERLQQLVYKDIPYIVIYTPGDNTKRIERPAKLQSDQSGPADTERFSKQWERFQAGEKQKADGNQLELLGLGNSELKQLHFMNILTIEHLAELPDFALDEIGLGARGLRDVARKWLANPERGKDEINDLKTQIAAQQTQIETLLAAQGIPPDAPRRGRPPKSIQTEE